MGDKLGYGHDGGHCSWWVSDGPDQTKWYKFQDDLDCTAGVENSKGGIQPSKLKIPTNLPTKCKDSCTINWLWASLHASNCEIYSNCFDVKITGVVGVIEEDYPMKRAPFTCIRPNSNTHKTSAFGRFINVAPDGTVSLEKVVDGDPDCFQYIVKKDDRLDSYTASDGKKVVGVLTKFDITEQELYAKNEELMVDLNTLPAVGTKLTIFGDCDATKKASDAMGLVLASGSMILGVLSLAF